MKIRFEFLNELFDFFIPRVCLHCCKEKCSSDKLLCDDCQSKLKIVSQEMLLDKFEKSFSKGNTLNGVYSLYLFQKDSPIQTLLHELKYQNKLSIGNILGYRFAQYFKSNPDLKSIDAIIPIPLHKVKKAERGYNQSYYFAKGISKYLGCKVDTKIIKRNRFTISQTHLSKDEREENIKEAFSVNKRIPYNNILLVDDVITTGSTISACAKEIRKHSEANIYGASIALV